MKGNAIEVKPTVLVADDDEVVRHLLHMLLAMRWSVLLATDGHEALQQYRTHRHRIATLIVDQDMPNLDGLALIEQVRAADTTTHIILYSNTVPSEKLHTWCRQHDVVFVPKGTSLDLLLDEIHM
jgi:CheY-like chemotaxis protein